MIGPILTFLAGRSRAPDAQRCSWLGSAEPRLRRSSWVDGNMLPKFPSLVRHVSCAVLLVLACGPNSAPAQMPSVHRTIQAALSEYRTAMETADRDERLERFGRAALLFARALEPEDADDSAKTPTVRNADLYVNWGNAALGAERLGTAVLAYRRALELDPDHSRARLNLSHARSLLPRWVPRPEEHTVWETFFAWTGRLSPAQWQMAAGLVFLLAAVLLAAAIRWRKPAWRTLAVAALAAWFAIVAWIAVCRRDARAGDAVVVGAEVIARSADSAYAPSRFSQSLPAGTELQVTERRSDWLRVRLYDGRQAWLPSGAVRFVAVP